MNLTSWKTARPDHALCERDALRKQTSVRRCSVYSHARRPAVRPHTDGCSFTRVLLSRIARLCRDIHRENTWTLCAHKHPAVSLISSCPRCSFSVRYSIVCDAGRWNRVFICTPNYRLKSVSFYRKTSAALPTRNQRNFKSTLVLTYG